MSNFLESPPYRTVIAAGALAAGASQTSGSLEGTDWAKYTPFNTLTVTNMSSQDLEVDYSQDRVQTVPAGSILTIEKGGIISWKITNKDGTNANSKAIEVLLERAVRVEHILIAQLLGLKLCQVLDGQRGGGCS